MPIDVLRRATAAAARVLETTDSIRGISEQERLHRAVLRTLEQDPRVGRVLGDGPWRPMLPHWPSRAFASPPGFDVAITLAGDDRVAGAGIVRWCDGREGFDAALRDTLLLAHLRATVPAIQRAFMLVAAPSRIYAHARLHELLDDGSFPSRELIAANEKVWSKALSGRFTSRPTFLPPHLLTSRLADAAFPFAGEEWELRLVGVRPDGEPWYPSPNGIPSADDGTPVIRSWPTGEPGPGMVPDDPKRAFREPLGMPPQLPNALLTPEVVPAADAIWDEIAWFAATIDGYAAAGGTEALQALTLHAWDCWDETGHLPPLGLTELRALLFHVQRGLRFADPDVPGPELTPYVRALVEAIRAAVASPGAPADVRQGSE